MADMDDIRDARDAVAEYISRVCDTGRGWEVTAYHPQHIGPNGGVSGFVTVKVETPTGPSWVKIHVYGAGLYADDLERVT